MYAKQQKFLILGLSKSGVAVARHLLAQGAICYLYEELHSEKIENSIDELVSLGAINASKKAEEIIQYIDVVIISPGVPINHELAVKAKRLGIRIIGELEYAFLEFSPTLVGITGTNGKTTTATLIDFALSESGIKSNLVGNVGVPFTSKIADLDDDSIGVVEVSSFQLESVNAFCPHISCVLNISPDHLERHYSMENYVYLKKRIFRAQRESEYCVLNFDDQLVRTFYTEVRAKVIWVSMKEKVKGAYCLDGKLYYDGEYYMEESEVGIKGVHNVFNALFALAVLRLLGVEKEKITSALRSFRGVRHRVELICQKNGINFYDDSKATNTASTMSAISAMTAPTILILGGSEKGENYDKLFEKIKETPVKHVVLTGASRFNMLDSANKSGYSELTVTHDFYNAIKIAKMMSVEGDNILLSPSCASFDNFKDFEERGDAFKKAVEDL